MAGTLLCGVHTGGRARVGLSGCGRIKLQCDTLATPAVRKRLERLREALTTKPVNVQDANAALKEALDRIVTDPERSRLALHGRHAPYEAVRDDVLFYSRHSKLFDDVAVSTEGQEAEE
jgi:hypothetical protein